MLNTGLTAPDFTLPRDGGGTVTLSALRPQKVVLFFYPRDDTPTCTIEAQDFTRLKADFAAAGAALIGISKDSVKSHEKAIRKHGLGVILASDEQADTCEKYGVWGEKSMYGKTFMGIIRTTLLIDGQGRVVQVWPNLKVKGHADDVLVAAQNLI